MFIRPLYIVPETFLNCCAFVRKPLPLPSVSPVPTIISTASYYILTAYPVKKKKKLCLVFYWYFVPYKTRKNMAGVWHGPAPFCEERAYHWQWALKKCILKGGEKHLHFLLLQKSLWFIWKLTLSFQYSVVWFVALHMVIKLYASSTIQKYCCNAR